MRSNTKDLIERLESMPFEEARDKILKEELGNQIDSPNHKICLSWLKLKESEMHEKREKLTLGWAKHAAYAAYIAAGLTIISICVSAYFHYSTQ